MPEVDKIRKDVDSYFDIVINNKSAIEFKIQYLICKELEKISGYLKEIDISLDTLRNGPFKVGGGR